MSSLLATIREAMHAPEEIVPMADVPGAPAPLATAPAGAHQGNTNMISQADHDAAVKAAEAKGDAAGEARGTKAATDRLSTALGAEGVKGDAGRMAAALDLATKSPAMAGADVAAFVVANVTASKPAAGAVDPKAYEQQRLADAGMAQPGGGKPDAGKPTSWADFRAKRNPGSK